MFKDLVIEFQYLENYGIHGWDGQGACPQQWKAKGGEEIIVTNVPEGADIEAILDEIRVDHEWFDDGSEQYIIGHKLEECGALSDFERDQYEYEGEIQFPAKRIDYSDLALEISQYYGA